MTSLARALPTRGASSAVPWASATTSATLWLDTEPRANLGADSRMATGADLGVGPGAAAAADRDSLMGSDTAIIAMSATALARTAASAGDGKAFPQRTGHAWWWRQ